MWSDLRTQFNVLRTLAIYNLQGKMKTYNYGFAWVLLEPILFIGAFRLGRQLLGGRGTAAGMTPLMFYLLGVLPLYACFDGMRSYGTLSGSSSLLAFPRVTRADIAIANGIASFAIYFLLFWLLSVPVSIYEGVWPPQNVIPIVLGMILSWIMGLAVGFAISGLNRVFPPMKQFFGYIIFGLRMISGFIFCIVMIPVAYWPYLTWNPLLHVTEMARDAWFESYVSPIASPLYILECTVGLLLLGLSVERYMRRIPFA
jgi:capsular polysaccharide transport system permease protein